MAKTHLRGTDDTTPVSRQRVFDGAGGESEYVVASCARCGHTMDIEQPGQPVQRARDGAAPAAEAAASSPTFASLPYAVRSAPLPGHHAPLSDYALPRRGGRGSDAAHTSIARIMTRDVVCVRDDLAVAALAELFFSRGLHGAPVLDAQSELVGFVSVADLARREFEDGPTSAVEPARLEPGFHAEPAVLTVRDVMVPLPISLQESAPISMAAALMAFEGVHRLAVVNAEGAVVGILSAIDVLRWLAAQDGYAVPPRDGRRTTERKRVRKARKEAAPC